MKKNILTIIIVYLFVWAVFSTSIEQVYNTNTPMWLYKKSEDYYSSNINKAYQKAYNKIAAKLWINTNDVKDILAWNIEKCTKIFDALWIKKRTNTYEEEDFYICQRKLQSMVDDFANTEINNLAVENSTKWENLLADGDVTNGSYDLLADIEWISKMLFKKAIILTKDTEKEQQNNSWWNKNNNNKNNNNKNWNNSNNWTNNWSNNWSNNNTNNWENDNTNNNGNSNGNTWNNNWNTSNWDNNSWNNNKTPNNTNTQNPNLQFGNICSTSNIKNQNNSDNWNNNWGNGNNNWGHGNNNWGNGNNTWGNGNNKEDDGFNTFWWWNNTKWTFIQAWWSDTSDGYINSLLKLNWKDIIYEWNDKNKNGYCPPEDYILAICVKLIPSWPRWPVWWDTKVRSIEEIFEKLIDSLKEAKENFIIVAWHGDEALWIDYKHVDLPNNFAFNIVLNKKPIFYFKRDKKSEKELNMKDTNWKNVPRKLAKIYKKSGVWDPFNKNIDKNKYLLTNGDYVDPNKTVDDPEPEKVDDTSSKWTYTVMERIDDFTKWLEKTSLALIDLSKNLKKSAQYMAEKSKIEY